MKVKIGFTVPNGINIEDTIAWRSFKKISNNIEGLDLSYTIATGACIGVNRNLCINNAKTQKINQTEFDFDYMLFVDYDIEFTLNNIVKLLSFKESIVSGAYRRKENPRHIHAGSWEKGIKGCAAPGITSDIKGVSEVDWVGGGFLLIAKEVFVKMEYPYFRYLIVNYEKDGELCAENTTEDFGFCIKAKEAGYSILCDCDCLVKHHNHVKGVTDSNKPTVLMVTLSEQEIQYTFKVMQDANVKGTEVPLWVNVVNSLKAAQTSIS